MKAVAWRVKDFADGWIIFQNEKAAQKEADDTDSDMQALGVLDSIQINEQRIATLEHEKSVAYALQNSYYASLTAAERERDRLSADNKRLREALEPFAMLEFLTVDDLPMRDRICDWLGTNDFRVARQALHPTNDAKESA